MKIHYVTGSRADFGLMQACLKAIQADSRFELSLIVTGQHLSNQYGNSLSDIIESDLPVVHQVPVHLSGEDGLEMAIALSDELAGFCRYWKQYPPDLLIVLGDRGEMVAAALAAVHLSIFVAHIHGGERSGTIDESFRHVITKLAHFHFPATHDAAKRIRLLGEFPEMISVIGAPGLVGIEDGVKSDKKRLAQRFGVSGDKPLALVVFHPVVQEANSAGEQIRILLESILANGYATIIFRPNSDAGSSMIDKYLDSVVSDPRIFPIDHLKRKEYLNIMASVDIVIGNSSSGIIESASFQVPCVNIGSRQNHRLRNNNTVDCIDITGPEITKAIQSAQNLPLPFTNCYGDGETDKHLVEALANLELDAKFLNKRNLF